jgi:hypothetical protein
MRNGVRVLVGLSVVAQVGALVAIRHYLDVRAVSVYVELQSAGLIALAAVAALVMAGFLVFSLSVAWLREDGRRQDWGLLAVNLVCLLTQVASFVGHHMVGYLVSGGLHVVSGLLLATWAGAQRAAA